MTVLRAYAARLAGFCDPPGDLLAEGKDMVCVRVPMIARRRQAPQIEYVNRESDGLQEVDGCPAVAARRPRVV